MARCVDVRLCNVLQGDNHRIIPFAGQFEPVDRPCSAPLPGGKLCPRRDREKVGWGWGEVGELWLTVLPPPDSAPFTVPLSPEMSMVPH